METTPVFLLANSMDRGAWQDIVHGIIHTYIYIYTHAYDKYKEQNAVFRMLPSVYNKVTKNIYFYLLLLAFIREKNQTKILPCQ